MSLLIQRFKALFPHIPSQKELDDAYLNGSVDIYDLERRMAEIDQRSCGKQHAGPAFAFQVH